MKQEIKAWIEAMRLRTLPVSVAGVITGTGCAAYLGSVKWLPAVICLMFAIVAQIASNFANEYYDYANGLDKKGREGFRRGVTEGDISAAAMKRTTYFLIGADCMLGLSLLCWGSWWIIPVGGLIAVFAVAYSAGPWPLSHHGLGDVAVILFFGVVPVCFTCYLQAGIEAFSSPTLPISFAIGILAANVLIVNNYRDVDDDKSVGKMTSVVFLGRNTMLTVYLLGGYAGAALCVGYLFHSMSWRIILAVIPYLITHTLLYFKIKRSNGRALNPCLGMTAMNLLLFAILLTIALTLF